MGDIPGMIAVLEMAQIDPGVQPEALRAFHRLLGNWKVSKSDRDHAARLFKMLKVSDSTAPAAERARHGIHG